METESVNLVYKFELLLRNSYEHPVLSLEAAAAVSGTYHPGLITTLVL
jgi:hypothetical protein